MTKPDSGSADSSSEQSELPICGILMPISATSAHSAEHWVSVLELLRRAIVDASMKPLEVWSGGSTDRITERILQNLFAADVAVCDISDLNANVMLELGMRLSSKKPTVVVADSSVSIPFDIKDFEVLIYPENLSMIKMEMFLARLVETIKDKYGAYDRKEYKPFLSGVESFEILEPQAKAVPFEKLVASRLDSIAERLSAIETSNRPIADLGVFSGLPAKILNQAKFFRFEQAVSKIDLESLRNINGILDVVVIKRSPPSIIRVDMRADLDISTIRNAEFVLLSKIASLGGRPWSENHLSSSKLSG